jgi:hypothetical protein
MYTVYKGVGNYISKPPWSKLKIRELHMKVQVVIHISKPPMEDRISKPPVNQVRLENPHESGSELHICRVKEHKFSSCAKVLRVYFTSDLGTTYCENS